MKHTKKWLFLIILYLILTISACDNGLEVTGIELESYPNKLYYVIGVDRGLNLEGGAVHLLTRDRPRPTEENLRLMESFDIKHDIDFSMAGIYIVYVQRFKYSFSFPIQVVSFEEIESIVNSSGGTKEFLFHDGSQG